jgi:hypothetical protein
MFTAAEADANRHDAGKTRGGVDVVVKVAVSAVRIIAGIPVRVIGAARS